MNKALLSLAAWTARRTPTSLRQALYRLGPLTWVIRRTLNRAAPAGLTRVQVAAGALAGVWLELDLHAEKDYWLGTYEPQLQAALKRSVAPGMVAYDVGANIGYMTLLLAQAVGERGRVFAFEALPANLARLQKNVELNGLEGRVTIVAGAVLDRPGTARFLLGPSGGTGKAEGSAGRHFTAQGAIEVQAISLDDFVYRQGHPPPQVVKMDIEGGEIRAFQGMRKTLASARPTLFLELHGPRSAQAAWETLTESDYALSRMAPGTPQVESPEALDWKAYLVGQPLERMASDG